MSDAPGDAIGPGSLSLPEVPGRRSAYGAR